MRCGPRATITLVKLEIGEDDIPLLVRTLEHYAAYLEATKRRMIDILPWLKP